MNKEITEQEIAETIILMMLDGIMEWDEDKYWRNIKILNNK